MKKKKTGAPGVIYRIIIIALLLVIGAAAGIMSPWLKGIRDMSFGEYLASVAATLLLLYLAFFIEIIIHEGGHLVFGLLTGYRFSSFRVLTLMVKIEDGRPVLRRINIGGTSGQCLMIPPDFKDGRIPYVMYNLGGVMMNLITSLLFLCAGLALRNAGRSGFFFFLLAAVGAYMAVANGVPFSGTVPNDGHNALNLGKDPDAVRAFWVQLRINQMSSDGVRLKDMPDEWFRIPEGADTGNYMISYIAVNNENRLMDQHLFLEAREKAEQLVSENDGLPPLYRALLSGDIVFTDLLERGKDADISPLREKEFVSVFRQMRTYPSVLRTKYTRELIHDSDPAEAEKTLAIFNKAAQSYPYPAEAESERELIAIAKEKAGEQSQQ